MKTKITIYKCPKCDYEKSIDEKVDHLRMSERHCTRCNIELCKEKKED